MEPQWLMMSHRTRSNVGWLPMFCFIQEACNIDIDRSSSRSDADNGIKCPMSAFFRISNLKTFEVKN